MASTSEKVKENLILLLEFIVNINVSTTLQTFNKVSLTQRTITTNENGVIGSKPALVIRI